MNWTLLQNSLLVSGTGDVIQPNDGVAGIGSGGAYALAAARALLAHTDLSAVQIGPRSTVLSGDIPDQSALHGLIARLGDLGIEITEVRPVP